MSFVESRQRLNRAAGQTQEAAFWTIGDWLWIEKCANSLADALLSAFARILFFIPLPHRVLICRCQTDHETLNLLSLLVAFDDRFQSRFRVSTILIEAGIGIRAAIEVRFCSNNCTVSYHKAYLER